MKCTRRQVLVGFFGLAAGGGVVARLAARSGPAATAALPRYPLPLPPGETATIHAAIEHALPGALAAGVADHIAYWMTTDRYFKVFVREFQDGAMALDKVAREIGGKAFTEITPAQKDAVFKLFQAGKVRLPQLEGTRFFEHLVTFSLEGYLADPKYGGNRDQVGWKFIGFKPCWWASRIHGAPEGGAAADDHSHLGH